jgi:hypothetical protein
VQALQSVSPPSGNTADFSLAVSPTGDTVSPGQSGTFTVSVTPTGGFNHMVMFSCSGLPAGASCTVAPTSVTLDGTNASTVQLVVMTTHGSVVPAWPESHLEPKMNPWNFVALLVLCFLFFFGSTMRRGAHRVALRRALWPVAAAILVALVCSSCGGGTESPPNAIGPPPGPTPAGTYAIVITGASGNVSHAATAQLTVN